MRDRASDAKRAGGGVSKVGITDGAEAAERSDASANIPVYIGDKLKALFDDVVSQPVPDHLLDLLRRLENDGGDD